MDQLHFNSEESKGYMIAVMSAVVLAMTGILIRQLTEVHGMEPIVCAIWRNLILVAVLALILECFYPRLIEIDTSDLVVFMGYGLILALFNYLWTTSVAINGAGVATFLVYSSVPFTALLGRIFLQEELNRHRLIIIAIALTGCLLVSWTPGEQSASLNVRGIVVGLGAGLSFALYTLVGRVHRSHGYDSWTIMLYSFGFAALFLMGAHLGWQMIAGDKGAIPATLFVLSTDVAGWTTLFILAVGPTLIGFWLYTLSLGALPAAIVNLIATLEPPLAALIAYFVLGEQMLPVQLIGCALVMTALLFLNVSFRIPIVKLRAIKME